MNIKKKLAEMSLVSELTIKSPENLQQRITELPKPPELDKSLIAFWVDSFDKETITLYKSGDWSDEIGIAIKEEILRREKS